MNNKKTNISYVDQLKKLQIKIWTKTLIVLLIFSLPFLVTVILSKFSSLFEFVEYIIMFAIIVIINVFWIPKSICEKDIERYKNIFAKNITLEILKNNFEDVKYQSNDDLPPKDFAIIIDEAKIPTTNSYSSDDYISAKYKSIKIEYSDISMGYLPLNSNSNCHENFKGKWLVISFDRNFKSNIQIGPRIFNGKKNKQMLKGKEYSEIKISDSEINKKFIIYADNKCEALSLLKSNIISKIKKLYKETKGKIFIFYLNNQIHIGIGDRKNFFEPSIYKRFDLEKEKKRIQSQIKIIVELIDSWI